MRKPMSEVLQELESDQDLELPMDPNYYDRLHARIMMAVERSVEKPPVPPPGAWPEKPRGLGPDKVGRTKNSVY